MKKNFYSALLILALFFCSISFSQTNDPTQTQTIVMKATGIKGSSKTKGYEGSIEIHGFSDFANGCQTLPCKISSSGINLQIPNSLPIQDFRNKLFFGRHIDEADLIVLTPGGSVKNPFFESYRIHMKDIVVVSISEGGDRDKLIMNIELKPGKTAWQTQELGIDGKTIEKRISGWDFINQVPFNHPF